MLKSHLVLLYLVFSLIFMIFIAVFSSSDLFSMNRLHMGMVLNDFTDLL